MNLPAIPLRSPAPGAGAATPSGRRPADRPRAGFDEALAGAAGAPAGGEAPTAAPSAASGTDASTVLGQPAAAEPLAAKRPIRPIRPTSPAEAASHPDPSPALAKGGDGPVGTDGERSADAQAPDHQAPDDSVPDRSAADGVPSAADRQAPDACAAILALLNGPAAATADRGAAAGGAGAASVPSPPSSPSDASSAMPISSPSPAVTAAAVVEVRSHLAPAVPAGAASGAAEGEDFAAVGGKPIPAAVRAGGGGLAEPDAGRPATGQPVAAGGGAAASTPVGERMIPGAASVLSSIVDAVTALADPPPAAAPGAPAAEARVPGMARTLVLQLSPASLGTVDVRLHVTGQLGQPDGAGGAGPRALDVELALSDRQALGLVSRERDVLAETLRSSGYDLHSLVIRGSDGAQAAAMDQRNPDRQGAGLPASGQEGRTGQQAADGGRQGAGSRGPAEGRGGDRRPGARQSTGTRSSRAGGAEGGGALYV